MAEATLPKSKIPHRTPSVEEFSDLILSSKSEMTIDQYDDMNRVWAAMQAMGLTADDIKEKPLDKFGDDDEKVTVKRVWKNHHEKKWWKVLTDLRNKVEGRKEINVP